MNNNHVADWYFEKEKKWQDEMLQLRAIVLGCHLTETVKWGCPCYTWNNRNIVLIHGFKHYCALLFFKGALLTDPEGMLVQQTPQVQAPRQIRFTRVEEILDRNAVITAYVLEAIRIEKEGKQVVRKASDALVLPPDFAQKMQETPGLQAAFNTLTPGRRRAYALYFSAPKKPETRIARINKCIPQILEGKGLSD